MNQCALVTARTSSTRLPEKCLELIAGDVSAIQIVIRRAKKIGCPVILATTEDPSDDTLTEVAGKEGVECFRGAAKNKIRRWADCFARYGISEGLLVDGDDLTFDFNVGARALQRLSQGDCDMVVAAPEMTPGFFTYGVTHTGIKKLLVQASNPNIDTDVITEFVRRAKLNKAIVPAFSNETTGHRVRLTIDYPEDIKFYRALYRVVDYLAPAPEIVDAALAHDLSALNWHKNADFLDNQNIFNAAAKKR